MAKKDESGLRGLATASLICSIASWLILGIVLAPLGIIFGIMSLNSKNSGTKTMATVGLVIGVVSITVYIFSVMILLSVYK